MSLTEDFVAAIVDWPAEEPELEAICRLLLVDGLAVAAAGSLEPGPSLMAALARQEASAGVAGVIGHGFSTSAVNAARINGMSMHVLDFEPMWSPANHAISPTLPALLALAEKLEGEGAGPQGTQLLGALAKGIEAQGRLRLASGQIKVHSLTIHPPGAVGAIATALACGTMLRLDRRQMLMAVGIAASRAGGLLSNIGSMTKALHCGDAAAHGLQSALLAASGFTADPDALHGPRGYGAAYFGATFEPSHLTAPVDRPRVLSPGPAWKLFPSQYGSHFAITAALDCHREVGGRGIAAVRITVPRMPYLDRPRPRSGLEGKFSFQYVVSAALLDGDVGVQTFSDRRRFSADMEHMLDLVTLDQDDSLTSVFDEMSVTVEAALQDGSVVRHVCDGPLGSWKRPAPAERIVAKTRNLLAGCLSPDQLAAFLDAAARPASELGVSGLVAHLRKLGSAELAHA